MKSIYDNWWRSGMNWNRFDFGSYSGPHSGDTVYQHDVKAFEKLYDDTSAEVSHIEAQAEKQATKVYDATQKVYHAATNVAGSAINKARAGLNASAKDHTKH